MSLRSVSHHCLRGKTWLKKKRHLLTRCNSCLAGDLRTFYWRLIVLWRIGTNAPVTRTRFTVFLDAATWPVIVSHSVPSLRGKNPQTERQVLHHLTVYLFVSGIKRRHSSFTAVVSREWNRAEPSWNCRHQPFQTVFFFISFLVADPVVLPGCGCLPLTAGTGLLEEVDRVWLTKARVWLWLRGVINFSKRPPRLSAFINERLRTMDNLTTPLSPPWQRRVGGGGESERGRGRAPRCSVTDGRFNQ